MPKIEIKATIEQAKLSEFINTRKSLLEKLQHIKELKRLESDLLGNNFHLQLFFEDSQSLDEITKSNWYTYLRGALNVLGEHNNVQIISSE